MMHLICLANIDPVTIGGIGAAIGFSIGIGIRLWQEKLKQAAMAGQLEAAKKTAEAEAAKIVAQAESEARTEFINQRKTFDSDTESTRKELRAEEKRLAKREDMIDQKLQTTHTKERMAEAAQKGILEREKALATKDRH
ncbi:MAG: DUF3552 domain-containing protein, partial [bacterium]|nr:DUF3552 domain-containing protein [bacterium]